jgi:hypothetical protein
MRFERVPNVEFEIAKGQTWAYEFRVLAPEAVQLSADVGIGEDALPVLALDDALASGDKLLFGENTVVTLDGAAAAGAESVPVATTTVRLRKGDVGRKIRDLTGFDEQFEVLTQSGDATPVIADAALTVTPATQSGDDRGKVTVSGAPGTTTSLGVGSYFGALWNRESSEERPQATASIKLVAKGFLS